MVNVMKKWMALGVLVLLAACTTTSDRNTLSANFRTGTEGLYFTLAPNLPPSRIYDDQKLSVLVALENRGATNVGGPGDRIYITGFDPSIITGIPLNGEQIPYLKGKDVYGPGDKSYISFTGVPVSLFGLNIDKYTPRLQITACYEYETIATANVCIDPDPNSVTPRQKVCTPADVGTGSQGAPVSVSTVQVQASPGTTRFEILIQNSGRGTPFRSGLQYLQECSPNDPTGFSYTDLGYVQLVDVSVAGHSIKGTCRPLDQDSIRLDASSATHLFCELDNIQGSSAYTSPLTVQLRYGYRDSTSQALTVIQSTH
jgi:predicted small secreted protein